MDPVNIISLSIGIILGTYIYRGAEWALDRKGRAMTRVIKRAQKVTVDPGFASAKERAFATGTPQTFTTIHGYEATITPPPGYKA